MCQAGGVGNRDRTVAACRPGALILTCRPADGTFERDGARRAVVVSGTIRGLLQHLARASPKPHNPRPALPRGANLRHECD